MSAALIELIERVFEKHSLTLYRADPRAKSPNADVRLAGYIDASIQDLQETLCEAIDLLDRPHRRQDTGG
jgi:hypothetical protein